MTPNPSNKIAEEYWRQYEGKTFVVKASGTLFHESNEDTARELLNIIREFQKHRIRCVFVHGAGKQLDEIMAKEAPKHPITQLRITPNRLIPDVIRERKAISQRIAQLCDEYEIQYEILDPSITIAERIPRHQATGRIRKITHENITAVLEQGKLAIIPFGGFGETDDNQGEHLNVNADENAAEVARALAAIKLIYVTNADGITKPTRNNGSRRISYLDFTGAVQLLREQDSSGKFIIDAGMLPKLEMAMRAVAGKVQQVHLVPAVQGIMDEVLRRTGSVYGTLIEYHQSIAIRNAKEGDAQEIFALMEECSTGNYATPNGTPYLKPATREEIQADLSGTIVLKHRDIVVGTMNGLPLPGHARTAKIGRFAVGENHQDSQYGRELLDQILARIADAQSDGNYRYDEAISITAAPGPQHLFEQYGTVDREGKYATELARVKERYGTDGELVRLFIFDLKKYRSTPPTPPTYPTVAGL